MPRPRRHVHTKAEKRDKVCRVSARKDRMTKALTQFAIVYTLLGLVLFQAACSDADPNPALLEEKARVESILPVSGTLLNSFSAKAWKVHGRYQINSLRRDEDVPGGQLRRVAVKKLGEKPFSVVAIGDVEGGMSKGDTIFVAIWARAHDVAGTTQAGLLSGIVLAQEKPRYARVVKGSATLTKDWALYFVSGTAEQDFEPGSTHISIHLAGALQTVDLGPWFVFNLGPGISPKTPPSN